MITTVTSWKSVLLIRPAPRMKKSVDSDNTDVGIEHLGFIDLRKNYCKR